MKKFCFTVAIFLCALSSFAIAPITGPTTVCAGSTITLSDTDPGGIWSSGMVTIATVGSSSGIVSGISAGSTTITYTTGTGSATLSITVNPLPVLSSALTPPRLCDSDIFNYTPMSTSIGATFSWTRAIVPGIMNPASSGTGNPNEQLICMSALPVGVPYMYTITAAGCVNSQVVIVTVNPTPKMSSSLIIPPICDGTLLNYIPTSATPGALFAWNRPVVTDITPLTSFVTAGSGEIHEYLYNATPFPIVVTYNYRLQVNGCINLSFEQVKVTINGCTHVGVEVVPDLQNVPEIYPNPTHGSCSIKLPLGDNTVIVADLLGKTLKTCYQTTTGQTETLDLTGIPAGTYIVETINNGYSSRQKLVIW